MVSDPNNVPAVNGGYAPIDGRQTHRCRVCGAYVEYRDKAHHSGHHRMIAEMAARIAALETPQPNLFEPPF